MSGERVQRRLATILAADVVGYSRLMGLTDRCKLDHLANFQVGNALALDFADECFDMVWARC